MRILVPLWCCLLAVPATPAMAQRAATTTMTVAVNDGTGTPLEGASVRATGPVTRTGTTDAKGTVRFQGLRRGEYRVRADHDGFVTLERLVTVGRTAQSLEMPLTAAPPVPEPMPDPEPAPAAAAAPPGNPASLVIVDFIEGNFIPTDVPVKRSQLGCTASATTTLLQVREPVAERALDDADEALYVVAGEGTLRLGNRDVPLEGSSLAVVPRGTVRGITRKGRNPLILLSVISGPPCTM